MSHMAEVPFRFNDATASDELRVGNSKLFLNNTAVTATATELNQLSGLTLGTAASANTGDFATAAQGALADTALQTVAVDGVTITGDGAGIPLSAVGGGGGTPGGNPGDVQVNDGAGGFGAATNLQDVAYLETVATDGTTITGDGAGTPLSTTGLTETCMVRLDTSIVNFAPTGAYTLIQSNVPNPAIWDASPPNPNFDANTGLYTVATAGVYRISWSVAFRFTTAGQTQASRIYVNGSPAAQGTASTTGNWPVPGGSILLTLNPGDTVGLYGYISQAGTNLVGDTTSVGAVYMSINKVSV